VALRSSCVARTFVKRSHDVVDLLLRQRSSLALIGRDAHGSRPTDRWQRRSTSRGAEVSWSAVAPRRVRRPPAGVGRTTQRKDKTRRDTHILYRAVTRAPRGSHCCLKNALAGAMSVAAAELLRPLRLYPRSAVRSIGR
jgi:hypothetical protein